MKYFDKAFFKFTLGFLGIVAVSTFLMFVASSYADGERETARPVNTE